MKKLGFLSILLSGLVACGGGGGDDAQLKKLEEFKTKMCACDKQECAEAVRTEQKKWEKEVEAEMKKKYAKRSDVPKAFMDKWEALEKPMKECYRKFDKPMGGDAPTPTPPTPTP